MNSSDSWEWCLADLHEQRLIRRSERWFWEVVMKMPMSGIHFIEDY
jgi:hypothetical protein